MNLTEIDLSIIVGYLVVTVAIGWWISKKASKNMNAYFLGGNKIPWYLLGVSNASGMFDITGTMWMVSICFVYGLKSVWLPWLWPVWNQIFLMVFMAVWLRRSNVMTGAEWLKTRFGEGTGSRLSHIIVVVFAVFSVIGFIAYGFEGIGKFSEVFFPWDLSIHTSMFDIPSKHVYAGIIMLVSTAYVVKGGMYSVVVTELLQFLVMTLACLAVGAIAIYKIDALQLRTIVPEGWENVWFGWKLNLDWSLILPQIEEKIRSDGYEWFSIVMGMMVFKGILVSIAGPVPGYDMQRILATERPRDAAKMSGIVSLVLFIPRYLMVAGLTAMALIYLLPEYRTAGSFDSETILPYTLNNLIPVGLKGVLLAGLVSAFMSTFAASVNAGPAYIVNDIYKKYLKPSKTPKEYVSMSRWVSLAIVLVGISMGLFVDSIDSALKWIVAALFGGYSASNMLKWVWWRFNSYGYFWGMLAGLFASLFLPLFLPEVQVLYLFPAIFLIALTGSVAGSLLTPPDDEEVLISFYEKVRPWGFWGPVYEKLKKRRPEALPNQNFGRDMFNCGVGIAWQMSLILMPIYLVIRNYESLAVSTAVMLCSMAVLKKNWYNKLEDYPKDLQTRQIENEKQLKA
ncbi:MAG: Na+:solute symporter [Cytophagales bacterium]|nr:Na+:solute symporter [Cytophagales bacterium]